MGDSDSTVKLYSLRVLREMLKTQHERLRDYAELTTLKVLKCFADSDTAVSHNFMSFWYTSIGKKHETELQNVSKMNCIYWLVYILEKKVAGDVNLYLSKLQYSAQVSQASEDVFTLLAPALPSESAVELLSPMVATEKHPMLLGTIKLFTKVSDG